MKKTPNAQETELFADALPILQGLLASGHYTLPADPPNSEDPAVYRLGYAKENEFLSRPDPASAVLDAIELAIELRDQVELEIKLRAEGP